MAGKIKPGIVIIFLFAFSHFQKGMIIFRRNCITGRVYSQFADTSALPKTKSLSIIEDKNQSYLHLVILFIILTVWR